MKYEIRQTSQFKRDVKAAKRQGRDMTLLVSVVEKLANGIPLDARYRDHALTGNFKGLRECHISPDGLLIYQIYEDVLVLSLTRIGSHSDLLNM